MPVFKVKIQFKGDKTFHITASDETTAQDIAVENMGWDIPDATYMEIVKVERVDALTDDTSGDATMEWEKG